MKNILLVGFVLFFTVGGNAQVTTTVDCRNVRPTVSVSGNRATVTCPTVAPTPTPVPTPTPTPTPVGSLPVQPAIVNFPYPTSTRTVMVGSDLQAAINNAVFGDVLLLPAGTTYTGNFILPKKAGSGWIVIRTSTPDSLFVPLGTRVSPSNSPLFAKIVSPNSEAAVRTAEGANGYRFVGIEFATTASTNYGIVLFGDGSPAQNTLAKLPFNLVLDRCYVHGTAINNVSRGVALNSGVSGVFDSYISDIHGIGFDTQAIGGWNGSGPYKIVNNRLEGAGENVMFGGADPSIVNLVPSDIEIVGNHIFKPLSWRVGDPSYAGRNWSIKNSLELKNAIRVLVSGNLFENSWIDAQGGYFVVLKTENQDGTAPWSQTGDITIQNNTFLRGGGGINMLGIESGKVGVPMKRVLISNNTFDTINTSYGHGPLFQVSGVNDLTIHRNTSWFGVGNSRNQNGTLVRTYDTQSLRFVFTDNIVSEGDYGVKGDGTASGISTLNTYFPGHVFVRNYIIGANLADYPSGNFNTK